MFDSDKAQIYRLIRLIDDMLDVTRIASNNLALRLDKTDLRSILTEVLDRLSPQFHSAGSAVLIENQDPCDGLFDHFRIEQVLVNLLTNALRYGGGKPVYVSLEQAQGIAIFKVRDEGLGIAKDDQERIFQRFERATRAGAESGLGLGLYIAKQIVEAHRGLIRVESTLGKGSTFIVELPMDLS
jgi:signal transduction histidine kinase